MLTYRYVGDLPTVFITLQKDGSTWVPSKNDTINAPLPLAHPLLELVPAPEKSVKETVPAKPEDTESPATVDELKEK